MPSLTSPMAPPAHPDPNRPRPVRPTGAAPQNGDGRSTFDVAVDTVNEALGSLGPRSADTSAVDDAAAHAREMSSAYQADRQSVANGGGVKVDDSMISPLRQQQNQNLARLTGAADGTTPSAAVIAGKQAAATAAGQQFGLASALQGRSAGGALTSALSGAADISGRNTVDVMAQTAAEQAIARKQLTDALGTQRTQEQDLGKTNANMNLDEQKMYLQAQLMEEGYSADMAKAIVEAKTKDAAAHNSFLGSLMQSGGGFLTAALG
jgi:hypothetical protein